MIGVPGIARGREGLIGARRAMGEFEAGQFAEDDRTRRLEAAHDFGILLRNVIEEHP